MKMPSYRWWRRQFSVLLRRLSYVRLFVGLLVGILFIYGAPNLVSWFVAVFSIVAVGFRLGSRLSFIGSLVFLLLVPIFIALGWPAAANTFAVACVYLMCLGLGQGLAELRMLPESVAKLPDEVVDELDSIGCSEMAVGETGRVNGLGTVVGNEIAHVNIKLPIQKKAVEATPALWSRKKSTLDEQAACPGAKILEGKLLVD